MTESEKGTPSASGTDEPGNASEDGAAAPARATPAQTLTNSRRRMSGPQQFVANVLQDVDGALDADFPGEDRVLILDAEDAFVADIHVGFDDGLPQAGAVPVADGAKRFRSEVELIGFERKVQDTILVDVFREEDRVFHVGMVDGALLAEKVDDFNGVAALPEEMAEVTVGANFLANGFAKFHQRAGIVDSKIGMHFESQALDAVFAGVFRLCLPVRNDFFFPLPVLHLGVLGGPAIGDPIRLGVLRGAAGAAGETNDDLHAEHFREKDGFSKGVDIFLC